MLDLDLNSFSTAELVNLQLSIAKAIAEFDDRKKISARAALEVRARELGFALSDLFGPVPTKKTRKSPEAKYRHLENPEIVWTGRGRKPRWFSDNIAAGMPPESMAI